MTRKRIKTGESGRTYSVRNDQKIKVKKCCASCIYKEIQADGSRVCKLMQIMREGKDRCPNWEIIPGMRNAGKPYGRVKSKQYLRFVLSTRELESIAIQEGRLEEADRASIEDIRERYREQHGSEFINI